MKSFKLGFKLNKSTGGAVAYDIIVVISFQNIKALYALVTEALKHWPILEILIDESKILLKEPKFNIWHVRILVTELLFGKKKVDSENEFVQTILTYEKKFRKILLKDDVQNLMLDLPKPNVVEVKGKHILYLSSIVFVADCLSLQGTQSYHSSFVRTFCTSHCWLIHMKTSLGLKDWLKLKSCGPFAWPPN